MIKSWDVVENFGHCIRARVFLKVPHMGTCCHVVIIDQHLTYELSPTKSTSADLVSSCYCHPIHLVALFALVVIYPLRKSHEIGDEAVVQ